MGSESVQKQLKARSFSITKVGLKRLYLFLFLSFFVVTGIYVKYLRPSHHNGVGRESEKQTFSMMQYSKHKPIPYKEWVRRRQEIALKPLHPAATLNKTEVGKWMFRKVMVNGELKPQYYNKKTHEVKWLKPPKDLAHYEEELDKNAEVEGGGILSLMDVLLKQRAEHDKKKNEVSDEDEEDADEIIKKTKKKEPDSGRQVGEHKNDGGWVFSPSDVIAEKEKIEKEKSKKEEIAKRKTKEEQEKNSNGKDSIHPAKGETAKSLVAKYLADLRSKNVDYKHR